MARLQVLLFAGLLAVCQCRPQSLERLLGIAPSPVYSYRFAGPEQTKQESRDSLGNIQGSYSVTYPDGGGTLTYNYAHPARQPAFRTTSDGPLGPAGTIIAFGKKNSKDNAFLIEMIEEFKERGPNEKPVVTQTEAVLIEAAPLSETEPAPATSFSFRKDGEAPAPQNSLTRLPAGLTRQQGPGFVNSKESLFLPEIRQESLLTEELGGRNPPIVTEEEVIVEASDIAIPQGEASE